MIVSLEGGLFIKLLIRPGWRKATNAGTFVFSDAQAWLPAGLAVKLKAAERCCPVSPNESPGSDTPLAFRAAKNPPVF